MTHRFLRCSGSLFPGWFPPLPNLGGRPWSPLHLMGDQPCRISKCSESPFLAIVDISVPPLTLQGLSLSESQKSQQKCLTGFAKSGYKRARLMDERVILHIKTFDSKWVCFRTLAEWASLVTNQTLSRVVRGRCRCKAFPGRWWVGVAN